MLLGELITQKKALATVKYGEYVRENAVNSSVNKAVLCHHSEKYSTLVFKHGDITVSVGYRSDTTVRIYKQEPFVLLLESKLETCCDLPIGQPL